MHYRAIIPAIDIMGGRCVRLFKGDRTRATVYNEDPLAQLMHFVEAGAHRVHIVDLDAAFGNGNNRSLLAAMRAASPVVLELGGGVKSASDVEELLAIGIDYIILGSVLLRSPDSVRTWVEQYPARIIAGIDEQNGLVRTAGWESGSTTPSEDLVDTVCSWGIKQIIFTNIDRDGTLQGPDLGRTNTIARIAHRYGAEVVLSGGIASGKDLHTVAQEGHQAISGIILGKAIYENQLDLAASIAEQNATTQAIIVRLVDEDAILYARGNEKSYKKTQEEGILWVVHEKTGRVLPFAHGGAVLRCEAHGGWYAAWLSSKNGQEHETKNPRKAKRNTEAVPTLQSNQEKQEERMNETTRGFIQRLEKLLQERKINPQEGSYTSYLFSEGPQVIRKKLAEEAIEVALAENSDELIAESADLVYHLFVLLAAEGLQWETIINELAKRRG